MKTSFEKKVIARTIEFVKNELKHAEGGHDWFHVNRVYKTAQKIASGEKASLFIVSLGALLHDIADYKFTDGDENLGPEKARKFLQKQNLPEEIIEPVVKIIENVSYKGGRETSEWNSTELQIVQDADRLDAMGAIGIARTFNYGGYKNRKIYDPKIKPNPGQTPEEYKSSKSPTINHFYEKLLLLKEGMHTETAKEIARERHDFMVLFLEQFYKEWDG